MATPFNEKRNNPVANHLKCKNQRCQPFLDITKQCRQQHSTLANTDIWTWVATSFNKTIRHTTYQHRHTPWWGNKIKKVYKSPKYINTEHAKPSPLVIIQEYSMFFFAANVSSLMKTPHKINVTFELKGRERDRLFIRWLRRMVCTTTSGYRQSYTHSHNLTVLQSVKCLNE